MQSVNKGGGKINTLLNFAIKIQIGSKYAVYVLKEISLNIKTANEQKNGKSFSSIE